jgi:hypothetical protein
MHSSGAKAGHSHNPLHAAWRGARGSRKTNFDNRRAPPPGGSPVIKSRIRTSPVPQSGHFTPPRLPLSLPPPSTRPSPFCAPFPAKSASFHKNPKSTNQSLLLQADPVCILLYSFGWYLALGRRSQRSPRSCRAPYRHRHLKKMTVRFRGHPDQPAQVSGDSILPCPAQKLQITRTWAAPVYASRSRFPQPVKMKDSP